MTLMWKHPFTCIVAGPTGCGKTQFTIRLIQNANIVIEPSPEKIVWCYGVYQHSFEGMNNVNFHEGIPEITSFDGKQRTL